MADTRHVDTARGDVGRDEQLDVARTESLKRMGALRLALVAMDRHRLDVGAREVAHDAVGAMLGAGEDQPAIDLFAGRSEDRGVGKECVSTFRSRGARVHTKKK